MDIKDRYKMIVLALMNDNMLHHKDSITKTVAEMCLDGLDEVEFDELRKNINGHGGISVDGKCSICLGVLETTNVNIN